MRRRILRRASPGRGDAVIARGRPRRGSRLGLPATPLATNGERAERRGRGDRPGGRRRRRVDGRRRRRHAVAARRDAPGGRTVERAEPIASHWRRCAVGRDRRRRRRDRRVDRQRRRTAFAAHAARHAAVGGGWSAPHDFPPAGSADPLTQVRADASGGVVAAWVEHDPGAASRSCARRSPTRRHLGRARDGVGPARRVGRLRPPADRARRERRRDRRLDRAATSPTRSTSRSRRARTAAAAGACPPTCSAPTSRCRRCDSSAPATATPPRRGSRARPRPCGARGAAAAPGRSTTSATTSRPPARRCRRSAPTTTAGHGRVEGGDERRARVGAADGRRLGATGDRLRLADGERGGRRGRPRHRRARRARRRRGADSVLASRRGAGGGWGAPALLYAADAGASLGGSTSRPTRPATRSRAGRRPTRSARSRSPPPPSRRAARS